MNDDRNERTREGLRRLLVDIVAITETLQEVEGHYALATTLYMALGHDMLRYETAINGGVSIGLFERSPDGRAVKLTPKGMAFDRERLTAGGGR